jgi:hypothetical protein
MKASYKKLVFGLLVVGVLIPFAAQAQTPTTYTPLAPLPCIQGNGVDCSSAGGNGHPAETVTFQTYVQYVFNLAIALAAVAAVFMMVWGGFEYMTSSAVNTKSDGLKKVYNAIGGLALVLCSFLILKTINPQFVQVPASLVTPLNLSSENTTSAWMTAIQKQANDFQVTDAATKQQISNIEANVAQDISDTTSLATSIYSLTGEEDTAQACKDAATYNDEPDVSSLCAEWQSSQKQQAQDKSAGNLIVDQRLLTNSVGTASAAFLRDPGSWSTAQTQLNDINTNYNQSYTQLVQQGATQKQLDDLADTKNTSLAQVNLLQAQTPSQGGQAAQEITTATAEIANIKDPAAQQQAAQTALNAIKTVGSGIPTNGATGSVLKNNFYTSLKPQITQLNQLAGPSSK